MKGDIVHIEDRTAAVNYAAEQFIELAHEAIRERGAFYVALSGGSTPKAIFERLCSADYRSQLDWGRVWLFWSDERSVPPHDSQSNYAMAMEAGFRTMPIPAEQIVRMEAEAEIESHAAEYEERIRKIVPEGRFDLVMLGMGPDGHTASLFPATEALGEESAWVVANFVPQFQTWRMTFTYPLIDKARKVVVYVLGESKEPMMKRVWTGPFEPTTLPIQRIRGATWMTDFACTWD